MPQEERRVDPMLEDRALTYSELRQRLQHLQLTEIQLQEHWADLKPAQAPSVGEYVIDSKVTVRSTASLKGSQIAEIEAGTWIQVLEVQLTEGRWRARLHDPAGWMSLQTADGSSKWAHKGLPPCSGCDGASIHSCDNSDAELEIRRGTGTCDELASDDKGVSSAPAFGREMNRNSLGRRGHLVGPLGAPSVKVSGISLWALVTELDRKFFPDHPCIASVLYKHVTPFLEPERGLADPCREENVSGAASSTSQMSGDAFASAASAAPTHDSDPEESELTIIERRLTNRVPSLLEAMNQAGSDVNELERKLAVVREHRRKQLSKLQGLQQDIDSQHGQPFVRARPYYEAAQAYADACRRAQQSAFFFGQASSTLTEARNELRAVEADLARGARLDSDQQEHLARATERVQRSQREREKRGNQYSGVVKELTEARRLEAERRAQLSDAVLERVKALLALEEAVSAEQSDIKALEERLQAAKQVYKSSMRELDQISTSVHAARHQSASSSSADPSRPAMSASTTREPNSGSLEQDAGCGSKPGGSPVPKLEEALAGSHPPEVSPEPREAALHPLGEPGCAGGSCDGDAPEEHGVEPFNSVRNRLVGGQILRAKGGYQRYPRSQGLNADHDEAEEVDRVDDDGKDDNVFA